MISFRVLDRKDCSFKSQGGVLRVSKGSLLYMKGALKSEFYVLLVKTLLGEVAVITDQEQLSANLWHQRFGHITEKDLYELSKQGLLGNHKLFEIDFCEQHIYGKACIVKFRKGIYNTKGILDYIHSDLWGSACNFDGRWQVFFVIS